MKKTLYSFELLVLLLLSVHVLHAQSYPKIYLRNCVELCIVFYADQSGSMDTAHNDSCRWAKYMELVPSGDNGGVQVGLYSFNSSFTQWLAPSASRSALLAASENMCAFFLLILIEN